MIELRKELYTTSYLHPRRDFQPAEVSAEMRFDPLTGHRVRVYEMEWRTRKVDFIQLGAGTAERCPFCPGALERLAARFPQGLASEGHLKKGSVTLIPNILPYAEHAGVAVLTQDHIVPMGTMPAEIIRDGFSIIIDFARKVSAYEGKRYKYAHLHWNYMPTSGGSLIHPHMQVYVTDLPLNFHNRVLEKAAEFNRKNNREFYGAYLEHEQRERSRYIASKGRCHLLAPFASKGMLGEYLIIIGQSYTYDDLTEKDLMDMASLVRDLSLYLDSKNISGFNLALFSSPIGETLLLNHVRIYPRVFRDTTVFATDVETPTLLYGESFSLVSPEKNAATVREFFESLSKTAL